uniref:Uncharacterized protein n=1 Tax=Romanomermis culicivorax TaxID=13658 RepID=A0A915KJL1_ROMCU
VLKKFFKLHEDELKNLDTQQRLTLQQFYESAYNTIDTFGSMANYKRHRNILPMSKYGLHWQVQQRFIFKMNAASEQWEAGTVMECCVRAVGGGDGDVYRQLVARRVMKNSVCFARLCDELGFVIYRQWDLSYLAKNAVSMITKQMKNVMDLGNIIAKNQQPNREEPEDCKQPEHDNMGEEKKSHHKEDSGI